MARYKIRQFCQHCSQITTQVRDQKNEPWKCLCCESGKFRTPAEVEALKKHGRKKPRFNVKF